MRILIASTGLAGHLGPLAPFAMAASRRGDRVVVVVPPSGLEAASRLGVTVHLGADPPAGPLQEVHRRFPAASREERGLLVERDWFGALNTAAMLPGMEAAWREVSPDLVVREPCDYASAILAERFGTPHLQVAISHAQGEARALHMAGPAVDIQLRGVSDAIRRHPYLSRFPASLDPSPFPDTRRYREEIPPRDGRIPDWWPGLEGPLVYLTLGTMAGGLDGAGLAYRAAAEALADLPVRVLLTTARPWHSALPPRIHVEEWVDQGLVLPTAELVVCHGGSGTTLAALAAGVPLVLLPMFADQHENAVRVAGAGAALVVDAEDPVGSVRTVGPRDVGRIREAAQLVLASHRFRASAVRIAEEMAALPTAAETLDRVAPAKR